MPRRPSGLTKVQIVHRKRANGDTYVERRTVKYDQKKRRNVVLKTKLEGKIPFGQTKMIPTKKYRTHEQKKADEAKERKEHFTRRHVGAQAILEWAGKESGIDEDLKASCGRWASKVISLARYWTAQPGRTLSGLEAFQALRDLPAHLSEDLCRKMFDWLGRSDARLTYFSKRAGRVKDRSSICYDSATVSTQSENLTEAVYGYSKDGSGLPVIKIAALYAAENGQPVGFAKMPGNIPDIASLSNALAVLHPLGLEDPTVIMDNGYYSKENIAELYTEGVKFLVRIGIASSKTVKDLIEGHRSEFLRPGNRMPQHSGGDTVHGIAKETEVEFVHVYKRETKKHKAGETVKFKKKIWVYAYHSRQKEADERDELDRRISELKVQLLRGDELTEAAKKNAEKWFEITRDEDGKIISAECDGDWYDKATKNFGFFALASSSEMKAGDALGDYRRRERIEGLFKDYKQDMDGDCTRVWDGDRFWGRLFVQFAALGYREFLLRRIREVRESLGAAPKDRPRSEIKDEDRLRTWLNNKSLAEILDWFDTVDLQKLSRTKKLLSEMTKRDCLFLQKIGYTGLLLPEKDENKKVKIG